MLFRSVVAEAAEALVEEVVAGHHDEIVIDALLFQHQVQIADRTELVGIVGRSVIDHREAERRLGGLTIGFGPLGEMAGELGVAHHEHLVDAPDRRQVVHDVVDHGFARDGQQRLRLGSFPFRLFLIPVLESVLFRFAAVERRQRATQQPAQPFFASESDLMRTRLRLAFFCVLASVATPQNEVSSKRTEVGESLFEQTVFRPVRSIATAVLTGGIPLVKPPSAGVNAGGKCVLGPSAAYNVAIPRVDLDQAGYPAGFGAGDQGGA